MLEHVRSRTGRPKAARKARPSVQQLPRSPVASRCCETGYGEINCWAGISSLARKCKSFSVHTLRRARVQEGRFPRELACAQVACDPVAPPLKPQRTYHGTPAHSPSGPSARARTVGWDVTPQQANKPDVGSGVSRGRYSSEGELRDRPRLPAGDERKTKDGPKNDFRICGVVGIRRVGC